MLITALCSEIFLIELLIWAYVYILHLSRCSWSSSDISLPTEAAAPITSNSLSFYYTSNMLKEKKKALLDSIFKSISVTCTGKSLNTNTTQSAVSFTHSLQICNITNSWLKIASLIPRDPLLKRLMACCVLLSPNRQTVTNWTCS